MIFSLPHSDNNPARIVPVFMPFAGCPNRCLYCAQQAQTGQGREELDIALKRLETLLTDRVEKERAPVELGFYGGTFTALPLEWIERFLLLAHRYRDLGVVSGVRCSTRPDAVSLPLLAHLRELGLGTVELGIQTFENAVLAASLRGYSADVAVEGCKTVLEAGLTLGIQLLPGLPGHTAGMFVSDVQQACALHPAFMRFYPCVVFRGTGLARLYERGEYAPWPLETAVNACAEGLRIAWKYDVRVIRMGIAHDAGVDAELLAGPVHPAFGSMVRGRALVPFVLDRIEALGRKPALLMAPQSVRGEFWGYKGECKPLYAQAGLTTDKVQWWDEPHFCLR
ncbi:MAG: elongator complex protein 3 [Halodesulfovibrio sp.]